MRPVGQRVGLPGRPGVGHPCCECGCFQEGVESLGPTEGSAQGKAQGCLGDRGSATSPVTAPFPSMAPSPEDLGFWPRGWRSESGKSWGAACSPPGPVCQPHSRQGCLGHGLHSTHFCFQGFVCLPTPAPTPGRKWVRDIPAPVTKGLAPQRGLVALGVTDPPELQAARQAKPPLPLTFPLSLPPSPASLQS